MSSQLQDQNPDYVHRAFSSIASRYVVTNRVLSMGADSFWRKRVGDLVAESEPSLVLDVATGSGDLADAVESSLNRAGRSGSFEIVGVDFCAPMLEVARERGRTNLLVADGLELPFADGSFDALTIGYGLRNMASWSGAIQEFARVLKPGGRLVVLDFSIPARRCIRGPYLWYLRRILPGIAGLLTGNREAYDYLGESILRFPSGETMVGMIRSHGFRDVRWEPQWGGISSVYAATRE